VLELGAAIEPDAGDAENRELDQQPPRPGRTTSKSCFWALFVLSLCRPLNFRATALTRLKTSISFAMLQLVTLETGSYQSK
jgi:hypothetical protein